MKYLYFNIGFRNKQTSLWYAIYIFWVSDAPTTDSSTIIEFGVPFLISDDMVFRMWSGKKWTPFTFERRSYLLSWFQPLSVCFDA